MAHFDTFDYDRFESEILEQAEGHTRDLELFGDEYEEWLDAERAEWLDNEAWRACIDHTADMELAA